jgi:MbtH protein
LETGYFIFDGDQVARRAPHREQLMLDSEQTVFIVVWNAEQQYSIWPEELDLPAGWSAADKRGSKAECLEFIEQVWTDMRPLSLREFLREHGS